jgi:hypothetical protein
MSVVRRILAGLVPCTLALQVMATGPAAAEETDIDQSIFAFGGGMVDEDMFYAADPFGSSYEGNPIFGIGYQIFPYSIGSVKLGLEAGLAGRFGGSSDAEIWGGVVGRYDAIEIANKVRIIPSFTFGLSHVTRTHDGREERQEAERDGNARTLFYLGPELSFSTVARPELEVFWRLHHRSGAWGTLGDMHGGSNANLLGVRYNF